MDARGKLFHERIEAPSADAAMADAASRGQVLSCVQRSGVGKGGVLQRALAALSTKPVIDSVVFSQDMATLLEAGVTVREAMGVLQRKEPQSTRMTVLSNVSTSISNGLPLSTALRDAQAFPELLVATVAASEETGDVATGLARYAKHQQSLRLVRDKLVGAAVYPGLLLVVGSLVVALLLGVVVPRFATLIDSSGKDLPWLSKVLMTWGEFVDSNPWVASALFVTVASSIAYAFLRLRDPQALRSTLSRLPGVAKVVREFQHLQMYRTTAILTSRGIPIHKALAYSNEYLDTEDRKRLQAAILEMGNGVSVSQAMANSQLSDEVATSMINVAERTGSLPEMMDRIADFYERTLQRNIDIVSRLIEPILMIIFGIVIGGIVVLMYLPIFDLASSIS